MEITQPWPWYIAGPLIGLTVPLLLILGNKHFGISANLRHICAACMPANIPFFKYDYKKEIWNFVFLLGTVIGGFLAIQFLGMGGPIEIADGLKSELASYNISATTGLVPAELYAFENLFTLKGFLIFIVGGFLIGFGTRYAGGCTSGHSIMGLSTLQWPSLVATIFFMIGGIVMANFILPHILSL